MFLMCLFLSGEEDSDDNDYDDDDMDIWRDVCKKIESDLVNVYVELKNLLKSF